MVQVVTLIQGQNLKVGYSDEKYIIVHGNIDRVKFIDASGGFTVKELFPDNKVNLIFYGADITTHYSNENLVVFSGYVEEYSIVTIDGEEIGRYELRANGVYVRSKESEW
jgi:hypothetical protein